MKILNLTIIVSNKRTGYYNDLAQARWERGWGVSRVADQGPATGKGALLRKANVVNRDTVESVWQWQSTTKFIATSFIAYRGPVKL